jgi:aspartate racemase
MKTLGILGGMGAEATHFFYKKIVENTPASCDQEHIPTIIFSNTLIPDRGTAIKERYFDDIYPAFINSAKTIEKAGADILMIPCNTAHFFLDIIAQSITIPVLDMIALTAKHINSLSLKKVGLLGTDATANTGLYHSALGKYGIETILPNEEFQSKVMSAISSVKSGNLSDNTHELIFSAKRSLNERDVDVCVLGCTELPLLFQTYTDSDIIDPMDVLSKEAVQFGMS